ncbi:MAG: Peptidase family M50 [bacterium ADurb.Bin374]|nr:MAG: Peptidase family M50 [bacterium ADurb.Bin374]
MAYTPDPISVLSLDLPAFIIGIGFHEFCHAFAADRLGDPTPRSEGRVSLNPIEHLDPIGTALPMYLALTGAPLSFGWGKPVVVDPSRFRDPVQGYGIVSVAGPLGNLLICIVFGLLMRFSGESSSALQFMTTPTGNYVYRLIFRIFVMNMGLFLFNLLPVPPLDGSKVVMWLGGEKAREIYDAIRPYSLFLLILVLASGIDRYVLIPLFIRLTLLLAGPGMAQYVFSPGAFVADFL